MKHTKKWFMLISSMIIAALLLSSVAFASPDQPADAQDTTLITDEPAQPQTLTTDDGVLELTLPNSSWKQLNDDSNWVSLSSGTDHITIDHLSNGEQLPDVTIAKDPIVQVYEVFYSTQNEVFILTGTVETANCMDEVRAIIESFKVLQYDTKQAVPDQPDQPEYGLREIGENMYCTSEDGVHVRSGCSTDDDIIGGVQYGDEVYVNGMVTKDGQDYGWLQIQLDNGVGYVWGEFFDENPPDPQPTPTPTDESMFLFMPEGGNIDIFQFTDGVWRSYDGSMTYNVAQDGVWGDENGTVYYDSPFNPHMDPYATGDELTCYSHDHSEVTLYVFSDDTWRDEMNELYVDNGDGTITGPHGFIFYENEEDIPDDPQPLMLGAEDDS